MKQYLLDTCTFLWLAQSPENLSASALKVMEDPKSILYLSPVSTWEIAIKTKTKKNNIQLKMELEKFVSESIVEYDLKVLPMTISHGIGVVKLPFYHKCPFDRLLISIARYEGIPVITPDELFEPYDVKVMW